MFCVICQELIEKLNKSELSKNEYLCMNEPTPVPRTSNGPSARTGQVTGSQPVKSRRTATWARSRVSDDGSSRYSHLQAFKLPNIADQSLDIQAYTCIQLAISHHLLLLSFLQWFSFEECVSGFQEHGTAYFYLYHRWSNTIWGKSFENLLYYPPSASYITDQVFFVSFSLFVPLICNLILFSL